MKLSVEIYIVHNTLNVIAKIASPTSIERKQAWRLNYFPVLASHVINHLRTVQGCGRAFWIRRFRFQWPRIRRSATENPHWKALARERRSIESFSMLDHRELDFGPLLSLRSRSTLDSRLSRSETEWFFILRRFVRVSSPIDTVAPAY